MARSNPGDLVVMCVDKHAQVVSELENRTHSAQAGSHSSELVGDPDLDPAELARDAEAQGQEAEVEALAAEQEAVEEAGSSQPGPPPERPLAYPFRVRTLPAHRRCSSPT